MALSSSTHYKSIKTWVQIPRAHVKSWMWWQVPVMLHLRDRDRRMDSGACWTACPVQPKNLAPIGFPPAFIKDRKNRKWGSGMEGVRLVSKEIRSSQETEVYTNRYSTHSYSPLFARGTERDLYEAVGTREVEQRFCLKGKIKTSGETSCSCSSQFCELSSLGKEWGVVAPTEDHHSGNRIIGEKISIKTCSYCSCL